MKIRSKPLHAHLFSLGVLNGTPEEIDAAKRSYRRMYKKHWKQNKRPRKEIRIKFTSKQFAAIKLQAQEYEMKYTTYARIVILEAMELQPFIARKDELLQTLQLVSMAVIAVGKYIPPLPEITEQLMQAETMLLHYLKN